MVTRDLRFNIFANDRASGAFARASLAADAFASRLAGMNRMRVRARVEADTSQLEIKLRQAEAHLDELNRKRTNPKIDADIALAQAKLVQITERLQELNKKRIRPEVQANIAQAEGKIAALQAQLDRLGSQRSSPVVTLQTALARNQIANLHAQIDQWKNAAESADPKVTVQIATAEAQMQRLRSQIDDLNRMKASPKVDANIAAAQAKIAAIRAQIDSLRSGTRVGGLDFGNADRDARSFLGTLNDLRRGFQNNITAAALLARNIRQLSLPVSLTGMIEAFASLGASISIASGALLTLPAAAAFAGAGIATLALGFHDLIRAIGPRDTNSQIKKAELEMSRLGEQAKAVARVVIDLKDEWNTLKQAVQNELFADLSKHLQALSTMWIPLLQRGFSGLATEFNDIAKRMSVFLQQTTTLADANRMFTAFRLTVAALGPAFVNISKAFMDLGVVGSEFLPGLAAGFTNLTERFANWTAEARKTGELQLIMARGMAEVRAFGNLLQNIGGIFKAVFDAGAKSGSSFLASMTALTGSMRDFLASATGQAGLIAFFQGIRDAIDSIQPGLLAIGSAIADSFVVLQPAITAVGTAFSQFAAAVAPTAVVLSELAVGILVPLISAFGALSSALGPVIPMVLTLSVAFKAFTGIGAIFAVAGAAVVGFADRLGMAALAMGMSGKAAQGVTDATNKFGNTLTRIGNSLPLIGVALIGVMLIYDQFRSKSEELANSVIKGSMTMQQAIDEETRRLQMRNAAMDQSNQEGYAMGEAIGVLTGQLTEEGLAAQEAAQHQRDRAAAQAAVSAEISRQLGVMDPLARATAEVTILEAAYNEAVRLHGASSREAATAADILKAAKERLTSETFRNTEATKTNTEAMIENAREVAAAANADLALERANLRLEEQQRRTAAAVREHGAASVEGRQATLDLRQAYLDAALAAGEKARADAEARGEADAAAQGARAYQQRLMELAATASGPTREALLLMIANLAETKSGANDAALAALGLKDDIEKVPAAHTTQFNQPGMPEARENVRGLKGEVDSLGDKRFKITATGEVIGPGGSGLATGGILPGYTPGRDVHQFYSPSAGIGLALSGGEAVMRPEWTRAVGTGYVDAANSAARAGGVSGVRSFISGSQNGGFARGGVIRRFAAGGVNRTVEGATSYQWIGQTITQWVQSAIQTIIEWAKRLIQEAIRKLLAAVQSMVGGAVNASGDVVSQVMGVASQFGWGSGGQWAALSRLIQKESSWNPNAANPTSSARGLFQKMTSIHGGVEGSAAGQAQWGLGYIRNRYGSPAAALAFHNRNGWYDQGGMLMPGATMAFNGTGQPERVLSARQTRIFELLLTSVESARRSRPGAQPQMIQDAMTTTLEMQRLRSDFLALTERLDQSLRQPRNIVVEDRSGNPVETARATSLALRL